MGRARRVSGDPGRRLRLATVVPSLEKGARYWTATIEALEREGLAVQVFTGLPPAEPARLPLRVVRGGRLLLPRAIGPHTTKTTFFIPPWLVVALIRAQPDVIISVEYSLATVWSLVAARLLRRRVYIYQEHRTRHDLGLPLRRRLYRRALARLADGLIANTAAAEEEIVTALRVPPGRVVRIPLLWPPAREALLAAPLRLEPPSVRPLFLFVGTLIAGKNAATLLEAAHRLCRRGHACSVWVAGDGPERPRLEAASARLGLDAVVRFLGTVPYEAMGTLYEACDVLVMPSYGDYRSVAVLEAMRFGRAVIDSKLDGNAGDMVRHGVNGFVFEPGDADELADHMAELVGNPGRAKEMGRASARIIGRESLAAATDRLARLVHDPARRGIGTGSPRAGS